MLNSTAVYTKHDYEAIKILEDFLPDKIFDAHAHLYDSAFLPIVHPASNGPSVGDIEAYKKAMTPMLCNPSVLRMNIITFPDPSMADPESGNCKKSDQFLVEQLNQDPSNVAEIIVSPKETSEEIEKRFIHPGIRGMKCYHYLAKADSTWALPIREYLPEAAWEVADQKKMCITLHMVRDKALSDEENLNYICTMAEKYPNAILILAHAARSFASWTAIEAITKVAHLENVWFDFSGICESPAMFKIMQKVGVKRCMWGSDYPVCADHGKAISLADKFYWIYQKELDILAPPSYWLIGLENLMAVRQACILAELGKSEIEDLFYYNAAGLWK